MIVYRGEMYYANLYPVVGSEQEGIRPVLVIQNNKGNRYSPTVVVAAITSRNKPFMPTHVSIEADCLKKDSIVMLEQIRTVDKRRLREYLGKVSAEKMKEVDEALRVSLAADKKDESMLMTLCPVCASEFYDGQKYIIKRMDMEQEVKEKCMYCNTRLGYDYAIYNRK